MNFNTFFEFFGAALAIFYSVVPSYGFIIIALTLVVMVILTPLTLKGTRSMMMMQQLQPDIKKLQSKYKDDRQKLNEELLKFYKENNINPVGGCLPLLVQMPVFIVLYNVLRGLTQRVPTMGDNMGWVTGQTGSGTGVTKPPQILTNFDPIHLPQDSKLYQDLSHTHVMSAWTATFGIDLSESCSQALSQGVLHALPYIFLIAIVGVSGFVQQRQIQGRNPNAQVSAQQQQIMKIMPIFLPVISFGLPSGLVLYFAVSNLYRIGQQWFISRSIYGIRKGEKPAVLDVAEAKKDDKATTPTKSRGTRGSNGANGSGTGSGRGNILTKTAGAKPVGDGPAGAKRGTKAVAPTKGANTAKTTENGSGAATPTKQAGSTGRVKPAGRSTTATEPAGRTGTAKKKPSPSSPRGTVSGPPTLQPRARKNKKR